MSVVRTAKNREKSGAMVSFTRKERYTAEDLMEIVRLLRTPNGCPWDREQTHVSIRKNLIEETYEVAEAIDMGDSALLREELGDLLLQIALHSEMEREAGSFDFDDVANDICHKLILRHPHVFMDTKVSGTEEVLRNWDAIKKHSKGQTTVEETLASVPKVLPALMRAQKVQSRAGKAGFTYLHAMMALKDLESEICELKAAMDSGTSEHRQEEMGDVLFSAVNVARLLGADAEETLTLSTDKFCKRVAEAERLAKEEGVTLKGASQEQLDEYWKEAKKRLSLQS